MLESWMKDSYTTNTGDVTISGLQSYYSFLGKLLNYGMNAEYARSLRQDGKPLMPRRHYMLTADHLMHFGAFMHERFRQFDFLVGLYDAIKGYALYKHSLDHKPLLSWQNLIIINDHKVKDLFHAFDAIYKQDNKKLFCNNKQLSFFNKAKRKDNQYLSIAYALCVSDKNNLVKPPLFESFDNFKKNLSTKLQQQVEANYNDFGVFRLQEIFTSKQLIIEQARQQMMEKN